MIGFRTFLIALLLLLASVAPAHAYIGPGGGLSALGALLALLAALAVAFFGFVWYPLRRMRRNRRKRAEARQDAGGLPRTEAVRPDVPPPPPEQ